MAEPTHKRILVIDDEDVIRNFVCDILRPLGNEVLQAEDGKAGLELFRAHAYRLVITDINMPGMGGNEVIEAIRAEDTETPIIVLTGTDDVTLEKALEHGANSVVHKPFRVQELLSAVTELLADD